MFKFKCFYFLSILNLTIIILLIWLSFYFLFLLVKYIFVKYLSINQPKENNSINILLKWKSRLIIIYRNLFTRIQLSYYYIHFSDILLLYCLFSLTYLFIKVGLDLFNSLSHFTNLLPYQSSDTTIIKSNIITTNDGLVNNSGFLGLVLKAFITSIIMLLIGTKTYSSVTPITSYKIGLTNNELHNLVSGFFNQYSEIKFNLVEKTAKISTSSSSVNPEFLDKMNKFSTGILLCSLSAVILLSVGLWIIYILNNQDWITNKITNSRFHFFKPLLKYYFLNVKLSLIYVFIFVYLGFFVLVYGSACMIWYVIPSYMPK